MHKHEQIRGYINQAGNSDRFVRAPYQSFHEMPELVSNVLRSTRVTAYLGKNIAVNQPDVEVLAVALREVPGNEERFNELRGPRPWINLQFAVVAVGPPGFSSAPFLSSDPKKKDADTKPLYESVTKNDKQTTVFYPFAKTKNNKDRGPRRSHSDPIDGDDGQTVEKPLCAELLPGSIISTFLRNENDPFTTGKIDGVNKNDFVLLQVGSSNADAAEAGRLVKVKKMKAAPLSSYSDLISKYANDLPKSASEVDIVNSTIEQEFPSLSQSTIRSGQNKVFQLQVSKRATASYDGEDIEICNAGQDLGGIKLSYTEAMRTTCTSTPERACKFLNLAIALNAVSMVVRSIDFTALQDGGWPDEALFVHIDLDKMLLLREIEAMDGVDSTTGEDMAIVAPCLEIFKPDSENVCWTNEGHLLSNGDAVFFSLKLNKKTMDAGSVWNDKSPIKISDGCLGEFYPLYIFKAKKTSLIEMVACDARQLVMVVQLRPECGSSASKRKRPEMTADDMDRQMECF